MRWPRFGLWIIAFTALWMIVEPFETPYPGTLVQRLSGALGATIAGLLVGSVLWWPIRLIVGKTSAPEPRRFHIQAAFAWTALAMFGALYEPEDKVSYDAGADYVYRGKDCEYEVTFPREPQRTTVDVTLSSGETIPVVRAEVSDPDHDSFVRADCAPMDRAQLASLGEDGIKFTIREYAVLNGLEVPEYQFHTSELGKTAAVRGFKRIGDKPITYEVKMHFGERSVLSLYVAAESTRYPTSLTTRFMESAVRR